MVVDSSRPITAVAREIGVNEALGFWVKAHRKNQAAQLLPLDLADRARGLRELERHNRELDMELALLKKAARISRRASVPEKYEFIAAEYAGNHARAELSLCPGCARGSASRNPGSDWRSRPESATAARLKELDLIARKAFEDSDGTYIYRASGPSWLA